MTEPKRSNPIQTEPPDGYGEVCIMRGEDASFLFHAFPAETCWGHHVDVPFETIDKWEAVRMAYEDMQEELRGWVRQNPGRKVPPWRRGRLMDPLIGY